MKQTVGLCDFRDAFRGMNRENNFSYEGLGILYEYLIQYEEEGGEEIELDVIALCCEWQESTIDDLARDYDIVVEDIAEAAEIIEGKTVVAGHTDDSVIFVGY